MVRGRRHRDRNPHTLYDDDVSLSVNPTSHPENGGDTTVTVTATIGQASNTARTVRVKVGKSGDSATEGNDYETVNDFNLTIAANSTSGTATFTLKTGQPLRRRK